MNINKALLAISMLALLSGCLSDECECEQTRATSLQSDDTEQQIEPTEMVESTETETNPLAGIYYCSKNESYAIRWAITLNDDMTAAYFPTIGDQGTWETVGSDSVVLSLPNRQAEQFNVTGTRLESVTESCDTTGYPILEEPDAIFISSIEVEQIPIASLGVFEALALIEPGRTAMTCYIAFYQPAEGRFVENPSSGTTYVYRDDGTFTYIPPGFRGLEDPTGTWSRVDDITNGEHPLARHWGSIGSFGSDNAIYFINPQLNDQALICA